MEMVKHQLGQLNADMERDILDRAAVMWSELLGTVVEPIDVARCLSVYQLAASVVGPNPKDMLVSAAVCAAVGA